MDRDQLEMVALQGAGGKPVLAIKHVQSVGMSFLCVRDRNQVTCVEPRNGGGVGGTVGGRRWEGWAGTVMWGATGACISCRRGSHWSREIRLMLWKDHPGYPAEEGPVRREQMPESRLEAFLLPRVEVVAAWTS